MSFPFSELSDSEDSDILPYVFVRKGSVNYFDDSLELRSCNPVIANVTQSSAFIGAAFFVKTT